ncbi:Dbr1p-like RNA lariat debranching enzyme [Cryptosporidium xiaoi]|uniref:Dbr1p-like RNA lariat debranching enzyme n=1 Tax=Cryptosporidium xiaoi TaxID=659607 RepID=A0AAV9XYU2_9CRYT
MRIAVIGCCHGELNKLYDEISRNEVECGKKTDLVICCGDMQTVRNDEDLKNMAIKPHRSKYGDFLDYYEGKKLAPKLTIFVGGNHEVPNVLIPLYFGGWVAPNIYYLGGSGVIKICGVRIAGISGIYKSYDHHREYYEAEPYTEESKRSWYHIRQYEIQKILLLKENILNLINSDTDRKVNIFISHDWPRGIEKYGNVKYLFKRKPYIKKDVQSNNFGTPGFLEIINNLRPNYWFSGHHHCFFDASIPFESSNITSEFRAMDKFKKFGSPVRYFDIPSNDDKVFIQFDIEWLSILRSTLIDYPKDKTLTDGKSEIKLKEPEISDYEYIKEKLTKTLNCNDNIFEWPHWDHEGGDYKNYINQQDFILNIIK